LVEAGCLQVWRRGRARRAVKRPPVHPSEWTCRRSSSSHVRKQSNKHIPTNAFSSLTTHRPYFEVSFHVHQQRFNTRSPCRMHLKLLPPCRPRPKPAYDLQPAHAFLPAHMTTSPSHETLQTRAKHSNIHNPKATMPSFQVTFPLLRSQHPRSATTTLPTYPSNRACALLTGPPPGVTSAWNAFPQLGSANQARGTGCCKGGGTRAGA
jgi:hypothetical protein